MPTIMIVDDDRITTGLLQTLLQLDGFEVLLAPDGAAAFTRLQQARPDAFLVDFHLADTDGTDFVRQLRENEAFDSTPVIMVSGSEREAEALEAGANCFLIKPFDPADLLLVLNRLLEA